MPSTDDPGPLDGLTYSAAEWRREAAMGVMANGAAGGAVGGIRPGDPGLAVSLVGSAITVTAGVAVCYRTGFGAYLASFPSSTTGLTVSAADATNPRVDLVYLRVWDNAVDGAGLSKADIVYLAGTAAVSPVAPTPGTLEINIPLATISVPKSGSGSPSVNTTVRAVTVAPGGINPSGSAVAGTYAGQYRDGGTSNGIIERYNGTTWKSGFYLAQGGILDWGGSGGTAPLNMLLAATSSDVINTRAASDSTGRYLQSADGTMAWGPGNASRDTTLARTGNGQLTLTGSMAETGLAPTTVEDSTAGRTTTSTSFVGLPVGTVMVGAVTVPASGRVRVYLRATFRNSTTANSFVSYSAVGSTSGTLHTANTGDALAVSGTANFSLALEKTFTGLVPGETLTVTPMHEVGAASTQTCDYRYLSLTPQP